MNAIKFIQQHGVERAREVVEGAPEWATYFDGYLYSEKWFHGNSVLISDLKRLVESVELIESWGGIEAVKRYDLEPCKSKPESAGYGLIKAIADYEAIYSGAEQ